MQRPSGTAAVRLSLWMLLFAAFATGLVQPVNAGTEAAPEIQDPAGDTEFPAGHDVVAMWIEAVPVEDGENGPALHFKVRVAEDFQHLPALFAFQTRYRISFISDDPGALPAGAVEAYVNISPSCPSTSVVVTTAPDCTGDESASCRFGTPAAAGASVNIPDEVVLTSTFDPADGTLFGCLLPLALLGTFGEGDSLTNLVLEAQQVIRGPLSGGDQIPAPVGPVAVLATWDRAPDEGTGQPFVFGAGSGGNGTDPNDTDGDGLNDTWEQENFGDLNQTAEGDPDEDGLTNGQEEALGTDPNNADTDGDGTNDKDDAYPLDPSRDSNSTATTTTTGSATTTTTAGSATTTTTSRTTSTTGAGAGAGGGDGGSDGEVTDFDGALEKLESDLDYLGFSAGGMLAVIILCIVALAARWSL